MSILRLLLTVVATALTLPAALLQYSGYDPARSATIRFQVDGNEEEHESGVLLINIDGSWNASAFCADLFTGIAANQTYTSNISFPGTAPMQRVAWLLANVLPGIQPGSGTAQFEGAALQLAVWDILHDNGDGLNSGRIQQSSNTPGGIITLTGGYLAALWTPVAGLAYFDNAFIPSGFPAQDMVAMVPEPSTLGLVLAGLSFAWARRRRTGSTR